MNSLNNRYRFAFAIAMIIALVLGINPAVAQQSPATPAAPIEKVPPPAPPYLNAAAPNATWKIHYTMPDGSDPGPKDKAPKETDATKAGDVRSEVTTLSDGSSSTTWFCKGVQLVSAPGSTYAVAIDPFLADTAATPGALDFFYFSWVNEKTFLGKTTKGRHSCYCYQESTPTGVVEAWIDVTTDLPVAIKDPSGERTYEIGPGTATTLTLPSLFQAAYDRHLKEVAVMKNFQQHFPR